MRYTLFPVQFYKKLRLAHYADVTSWVFCVQVQKLQSIIASRATQYSHDAKRKEREAAKLKERLSQLLVDRKDKKLGNSGLWNIGEWIHQQTVNNFLTYYCSK